MKNSDNETDFETSHPLFDEESNELLLSIDDISIVLDQCNSDYDNIGISFETNEKGKWDVLEIYSLDGSTYKIGYEISSKACTYYKKNISRAEVINSIEGLPMKIDELNGVEFEIVGW